MTLKITIEEYIFKTVQQKDIAPETCKKIKERLCFTGKAIQARWSGESAWVQMDHFMHASTSS